MKKLDDKLLLVDIHLLESRCAWVAKARESSMSLKAGKAWLLAAYICACTWCCIFVHAHIFSRTSCCSCLCILNMEAKHAKFEGKVKSQWDKLSARLALKSLPFSE